ncbi:MAG: virulence protein [Eubacteriales bacterium]|nr:virulence protein [Eubacteriales bacterium]
MTVKYNVTGSKRKELVLTIAKWLGSEVKYLGAPTFAYEVDYFTIDKDGTLIFDDRADSEVIERLLEMLYDNGFEAESLPESENTGLCISMPKSLFTEKSMENLKNIIASKESLLKKVFGTDELSVLEKDEKVSFPWFCGNATPEEIRAYENFICRLCEMARTQKRVNAIERPCDNERYSFRCFLLRLGFIGSEYKEIRKILLKNLNGNAAFKAEKSKEAE